MSSLFAASHTHPLIYQQQQKPSSSPSATTEAGLSAKPTTTTEAATTGKTQKLLNSAAEPDKTATINNSKKVGLNTKSLDPRDMPKVRVAETVSAFSFADGASPEEEVAIVESVNHLIGAVGRQALNGANIFR